MVGDAVHDVATSPAYAATMTNLYDQIIGTLTLIARLIIAAFRFLGG